MMANYYVFPNIESTLGYGSILPVGTYCYVQGDKGVRVTDGVKPIERLPERELANDKLGKELFSRERNTMSTPIYDGLENPVTTDASGQPTAKPTAKVAAGALTGLALTVVVAVLTAITPDLLQFLGPWAGPAFAGIGALAVALGAYIKKPTGEIS